MDFSSKLVLHASCEKLLAVAAPLVLPTLIPLGGRTFEWGFEYDFLSQTPLEEGVLPLINEQMRRLVSESIPFETLSMVPQNAAAFLQKKQPHLAESCLHYPSNLVPLCKVRDFYDICPEELLATSREIRNFSIYELFILPDSCIRLRGCAFEDKKELKNYLKQIERAKAHDPVQIAQELDLITLCDEEVVWHPQGIACKKVLEGVIKAEQLQKGYKEFFCADPLHGAKSLFNIYKAQKKPKALPYRFCQDMVRENDDSEGLFQVRHSSSSVQYTYTEPSKIQQELISSLHFMKQMANILNIESSFLLLQRGKDDVSSLVSALKSVGYPFEIRRSDATQIELHAFDQRLRSWPISKLTLMYEQDSCIECVAVLSYERLLAIMLEKEEGFLPFWLAPLQIRLLPVEQETMRWSEEFAKKLTLDGFRVDIDMRSTPLGERMYQASLQKAACAVVIGKKELGKQELRVRFLPQSAESTSMSVTQFIEKIRVEGKATLESESRDSSS